MIRSATNSGEQHVSAGPMAGVRVLDISTVVAGPFAAALLADFGAEVIKVEVPVLGDGLRALPPHRDGIPLWWKVVNRNKQGMTLDLRKERGAELLRRLVPHCDVLVENFRPGTLERWGLGPDILHAINPELVILRVSAFGQTGPYAQQPGFARIADAMSGLAGLCGDPDGPPMHPGYPLPDGVAGLLGAFGVLLALRARDSDPERLGQVVDASLVESMFRLLDFLPIEYDQLGLVRRRTGNSNAYSAPGNVYRAEDGLWITIPASTQSIFRRLCVCIGRPDFVDDPRFATNVERLANRAELEEAIAGWVKVRKGDDACAELQAAEVPAAPILEIDRIFEDPHFRARDMIPAVPDEDFGEVRMQGITPRLSRTPGSLRTTGPRLSANTDEILMSLLGLSAQEITELREEGVI